MKFSYAHSVTNFWNGNCVFTPPTTSSFETTQAVTTANLMSDFILTWNELHEYFDLILESLSVYI